MDEPTKSEVIGNLVVRFLEEAPERCGVCVWDEAVDLAFALARGVAAGMEGRLTPEQMATVVLARIQGLVAGAPAVVQEKFQQLSEILTPMTEG